MLITRRHLLAGASAAAALRPFRAFAEAQCRGPVGGRECIAEVDVGIVQTAQQRCDSWCWAACIQTVFGLNGYDVDQQAAVEALFGDPEKCEGANLNEIIYTITGTWTDAAGRRFHADARQLLGGQLAVRGNGSMPSDIQAYSDLGARQIVGALSKGRPLIMGTYNEEAQLGHAIVLTGARWETYPKGGGISPLDEQVVLTDIAIRDPWYLSENHRVLTADELRQAFWVVAVEVD